MRQKIGAFDEVFPGDEITIRIKDQAVLSILQEYEVNSFDFVSGEREVPDLPTEPGAYIDQRGGLWILTPTGDWQSRSGIATPDELAELIAKPGIGLAPLTRLIPEESEAAKIADWLAETYSPAIAEEIRHGDWKESN